MTKSISVHHTSSEQAIITDLPIVNQFRYELGGATTQRIVAIYLTLVHILGILFEIHYLTSKNGYLPDVRNSSEELQQHMYVLESKMRTLISRTTSPSSLVAFYAYIQENMYSPKPCMKICQKFIETTVRVIAFSTKQSSSTRIKKAKTQREYMKRRRETKSSDKASAVA